MKKKMVGTLSLLLGLLLSVSLAACKDKKQNDPGNTSGTTEQTNAPDRHEAKSEWKSNETKHWHECAAEGHTDKLDEADHTWDAGKTTSDPTETAEGVKTFTCTVCGWTKTEAIPVLAHTHKFDTTKWEKDANKHWHGATCGHDVKQDEADHIFETWTETTPAGYGTTGTEESQCPVCGYKTTRTIAALDAKENSVTLKNGVSSSKVYNAQAIALTAADFTRNGDGAVTLSYRVKGTEDWTADAPTNAGTYEIKVSVAATAEWKACEAVIEYTIDKYELTELYKKTYTKEYNGTIGISVELNPFDDVKVSVNIAMKKADAGTEEIARVWVVGVTQKDNYTIDQSKIKAKITAKMLKFNHGTLTKEYDGTARFTYSFTEEDGLISGDECTYSFDIYDYYGNIAYINAGNYTDLTYKNDSVSNSNYSVDNVGLSDPQGTTLTIKKKVLSGLEFTINRTELTGETGEQTIEREVAGTNGKVRVYITFDIQSLCDLGELRLTTGEPEQGEAKVEFNIDEGDDYENCEFDEDDIGTLTALYTM